MRMPTTNSFCSLLLALLLIGCTSRSSKYMNMSDALPAIYPDYIGVTVPIDIAPLCFAMANDSATQLCVEVKGSRSGTIRASGTFADFDIDEWHRLLRQNLGDSLLFTVSAEQDGQWTQYQPFPVYVSSDSLSDWGITYRRIAPGFEMYGHMGIYQRQLATFTETSLFDNSDMPGTCINCHTSNRGNTAQAVFHVRGENGATAMKVDGGKKMVDGGGLKVDGDGWELLKARNDSLGGSMVYPAWHPEGRYCAFSTNKTSQMFHTASNKRVEVYDSSSDVFVYDSQTHNILRDTIIMRKYWAENCPSFSPDGQWLYFTTARRQVYPTDYDKERYSLCRVAFDAATGRLGTQVDTLVNTRLTGKSVSWARPSRNGRYIIYPQADYGYFTIWHSEADLWLLDMVTGLSRPLDEVNSSRAESFPAWSSDTSGWFLFTSRRDDGLYSRLYLSHLDTLGRATKPFMLPQRDPKRYYLLLPYSYNTPDFISLPIPTNNESLKSGLRSSQRTETKVVQP